MECTQDSAIKKLDENCDSLEIGAASKSGKIKIYFNSDNVEDAKKKVDNAIEVKNYANAKISINI